MFVLSKRADSASQVIATLLATALVLYALGVQQYAQAANVTFVSDTLSDSDSGSLSNHSISFIAPSGVALGQSIAITFPAGFSMGSVAFGDIDLEVNGVDRTLAATPAGATWGATVSGQVLTLLSGTGTIDGTSTIVVKVGTNADSGVNQVTNNVTAGSYQFDIAGTMADSGHTRVAITDNVLVTAKVDTTFTFVISGLATSTAVNGATSTISATTSTIPFGTLTAGVPQSIAQRLNVTTNAIHGFVVTVEQDQNLLSSTGADIDGFVNGSYVNTPTTWSSPTNVLSQENTYGHWGLTTNDSNLTGGAFGSNQFVAASTTPRLIFDHNSSSDGTTQDSGKVDVLYKIEIASLQEAADDYSTILTYIATPTF